MKNLVIIPAYNEEATILNTVNTLRDYSDFDFIVINDGSVDATESILRENNIPHITLIRNLGIGGALQTGYKYALQKGYDTATQLDGDGQHDPKYLKALLDTLIANDADMVIGSRYIEKKGFQSSFSRRFGKTILTGIIKLLTGRRITDPTSGFRMCSRKTIARFAASYPTDYPEPETVTELLAGNKNVCEIAVIMHHREGGRSSITALKSAYYMLKVSLAIFISYIFSRRRDKK